MSMYDITLSMLIYYNIYVSIFIILVLT